MGGVVRGAVGLVVIVCVLEEGEDSFISFDGVVDRDSLARWVLCCDCCHCDDSSLMTSFLFSALETLRTTTPLHGILERNEAVFSPVTATLIPPPTITDDFFDVC